MMNSNKKIPKMKAAQTQIVIVIRTPIVMIIAIKVIIRRTRNKKIVRRTRHLNRKIIARRIMENKKNRKQIIRSKMRIRITSRNRIAR